MLYEAKQGTKAYEYIKSILDAEFEEHQAYMKRVEEAVGFKFEKYQGYQPNRTLTRVYEITAIWVLSERYDTLDKKVWKKVDGVKLEDGYYIAIAPNKRSKQGKAIAAVLTSYKSFTHHFQILKELNIEVPHVSRFSITQLLRHKERIFVYFDDSIGRIKLSYNNLSRIWNKSLRLIKVLARNLQVSIIQFTISKRLRRQLISV